MRLFHFSDDGNINKFKPRSVRTPSLRPPGRDWLNGPLVWAIDDDHQPMYLFPRECPRILLWPVATTNRADVDTWFGESPSRMIAYIEWDWLDRLTHSKLYRYEFPTPAFQTLDDVGMWVSDKEVMPIAMTEIENLPAALQAHAVELRIVERLAPLKSVWSTSLHTSGIRLRNAKD